MRFRPLEASGLRVLIIDDFYEADEFDAVKEEARKLVVFGRAPELAGAASDRKRGRALVLDRFFEDIVRNRDSSTILAAADKLRSDPILEAAITLDASYRHLEAHDSRFSVLNYYGDRDYYKAHTDNCAVTAIVMFSLGKVDGGDLFFEQYQTRIPFQENRCVLFPAAVRHAATPVSTEAGAWRCSVATFFRYT